MEVWAGSPWLDKGPLGLDCGCPTAPGEWAEQPSKPDHRVLFQKAPGICTDWRNSRRGVKVGAHPKVAQSPWLKVPGQGRGP